MLNKAKNPGSLRHWYLLPIVLAAVVFATVLAGSSGAGAASVVPKQTYTNFTWPGSGYTNFDWTVTPLSDPSPQGYFWSHEVWFINGDTAYFGIQTEGSDPSGKIAIFSVWDSLAAQGPQYAGDFGGEGTGYTARITYPWQVNRSYRLRIIQGAADGSGRWWSAYIKDNATGVDSLVGSIKVPLGWGGLSNIYSAWTEYYSSRPSSCADLKHAAVKLTGFSANNGSVTPRSHSNTYNNDATCTNSVVTEISNGVQHDVGTYIAPPPAISSPSSPSAPINNSSPATNPSTTPAATTPAASSAAPEASATATPADSAAAAIPPITVSPGADKINLPTPGGRPNQGLLAQVAALLAKPVVLVSVGVGACGVVFVSFWYRTALQRLFAGLIH